MQKTSQTRVHTRGTPKRLKQKRVKNSKVEFSEKAEKFVRRKGVREVGGKSGYVFSTQKLCQQFSQDRGSNGRSCSYLSQEVVKPGQGGGGRGGGAEKSCWINKQSHLDIDRTTHN